MPENHVYSYQFFHTTEAAWDAMYEAILGAQKSIFWEIYIFVDDQEGSRFLDALVNKAKSGVEVKIVVDAFGSSDLSKQALERLKAAGASLVFFNRLYFSWNLYKWYQRAFSRNHRKVLIVDENIVFLGGVNVSIKYKTWDDLYVRISGKVARPLLRAFAKSYIASGGKKSEVKRLLHPKLQSWRDFRYQLRFITHSSRFQRASPPKQLFVTALAAAKETVDLVTPYFVPGRDFLRALTKARARGVKVNLYLPLRADHKIMDLLARWYYRVAEKAGAKIYILKNMNHSKAMTVDNKYGMVGSANLSRRSFLLDAEAGVEFNDEKMVSSLNTIFNDWKSMATPYEQIKFNKLSLVERLQQRLARALEDYF